jgi:hypothetical protein
MRRLMVGIALLGLVPGCAQVISSSSVEVMPRTDAKALVIGPSGGEITGRDVKAAWTQDADRLTVRFEESRTCNSVRHVPVVRIERVERRTARGAMWFEYGLGGGAMVGGLIGLIRPEWYSQARVTTEDGRMLEDKRTGYRIGGILTGIGTLLLTAAVIDTVRTRDEVRYADAYRREEGDVVQCMDPLAPMEGQSVELLVGKWSSVEGTDDGGGARFLLPGVEDLPEDARKVIEATAAWDVAKAEADAAAVKAEEEAVAREKAEAEAAKKGRRGKSKGKAKEKKPAAAGEVEAGGAGGADAAGAGGAGAAAAGEAEVGAGVPAAGLGPRPEPVEVTGVLRLDGKRAMAVAFLVPYDAEKAKGYEGKGELGAGPKGGPAPGSGKETSQKGSGTSEGDAKMTGKGEGDGDGKAKKPAKPPVKKSSSEASKPDEGTRATETGEGTLRLGGGGAGKKKTGTNEPNEAQ